MLTAERLRGLLDYDPLTGVFTWRVTRGKAKAGQPAGYPNGGYVRIEIDSRPYLAHRLVWLHVTGEWPVNDVDHWDNNGMNNRWKNLRDTTHKQNQENRKRPECGVNWDPSRGKWAAQIMHNYRRIHLGRFDRKEDAIAARLAAEKKLFTHSKGCEACPAP